MRRLLFVLPVVAFLGVGLGLFYGLGRDPGALPSVLIDQPVPGFDLPPIEGYGTEGLVDADLSRDGPALLSVFASWCGPCRVEHPILTRLAEEEGIPLFGLNYKDAPNDARRWLEALGDPYRRIGADRSGRVAIDFGVYGVPETFVIDKQGRIRHRHAGPLMARDVERLMAMLEELGEQ